MESAMTNQPQVPDPETAKHLLANLRRTHLEMEEFNLELEEITAKIEHDIQQKRLIRVRRSLDAYKEELPNLE